MSLNVQKKILYIPILNFIIAFGLVKRCFSNNVSKIWLFKKIFKIFLGLIAVTVIRAILFQAIDSVQINNVIFYADVYLSFFIIAKVSLDAQIELEKI